MIGCPTCQNYPGRICSSCLAEAHQAEATANKSCREELQKAEVKLAEAMTKIADLSAERDVLRARLDQFEKEEAGRDKDRPVALTGWAFRDPDTGQVRTLFPSDYILLRGHYDELRSRFREFSRMIIQILGAPHIPTP